MTKEELIKHLKICAEYCIVPSAEAFNMIIKLLEQQPSDNCVSRADVKQFVSYIQSIKDSHNEKDTPINYGTICDLVIRGWKLMELPSVTPTHCIAAVSFSKEDLKDICNERIEIEYTHSTCKDCKHNRPNSYARTMFSCERGNRFKLRDCEDFYCADFEK